MARISRALLSVTDKTGVVALAQALSRHRVEILSTGGTARVLSEAGVAVKEVGAHTGFPEMLDGRIKTLHPMIHGGLLGRRDLPGHVETMRRHAMLPIDLIAVNLYRFEETVVQPGVSMAEAIENIDIGGPAMIRSAAKNHNDVSVVTDPTDYPALIAEMDRSDGEIAVATNRRLAAKAFALTAAYDAAIADHFSRHFLDRTGRTLRLTGGRPLRYGENAHQQAVFYPDPEVDEPNLGRALQLHGKELSYNNLVDGDAALEAAKELAGAPGVALVKHTNPCGYATGHDLAQALEAAWQGDPVSAFGSVIAVTQKVDMETARRLKGRFVEILIAPGFFDDALEFLRAKSQDIRLLEIAPLESAGRRRRPPTRLYRHLIGGMLEQDRDTLLFSQWESMTRHNLDDRQLALAEFTWKAAKHTKSNAIVLGWEYSPGHFMVVGMGAGQPNRIDSLRKLAVPRAHENWKRLREDPQAPIRVPERFEEMMAQAVLASDAFFPFADTVEAAAEHGLRAIVQPGGSKRDDEVIAAAERHGIALIFTGTRHFRH